MSSRVGVRAGESPIDIAEGAAASQSPFSCEFSMLEWFTQTEMEWCRLVINRQPAALRNDGAADIGFQDRHRTVRTQDRPLDLFWQV